jgi:hypothetical protein
MSELHYVNIYTEKSLEVHLRTNVRVKIAANTAVDGFAEHRFQLGDCETMISKYVCEW